MDERGQPSGGGEVLGLELLRVRKVIAELLDVAGEAVRLTARMDSERSETRGVAYEDVGLVFDLEAVKERALGPAALALRTKRDGFLEAARRDRRLVVEGPRAFVLKRLEGGDYGYCVDTGEEIGLDRLEARLTAERTIDAQERWEHLQKQQGD